MNSLKFSQESKITHKKDINELLKSAHHNPRYLARINLHIILPRNPKKGNKQQKLHNPTTAH